MKNPTIIEARRPQPFFHNAAANPTGGTRQSVTPATLQPTIYCPPTKVELCISQHLEEAKAP